MTSTNTPCRTTWKQAWKEWLTLLLLHCVVLVVASVTVGLFLDAALSRYWLNTSLEPFAPAIALVALVTGYFVASRSQNGRVAVWTWTVGVLWLAFGIYDVAWGGDAWDPRWSIEKTRFAYVIANLFGPTDKCGGSECLGELLFTMPFTASVMYSIGAYIKIRRIAKTLRISKDDSFTSG